MGNFRCDLFLSCRLHVVSSEMDDFLFHTVILINRQGQGILTKDGLDVETCKWQLNRQLLILQHCCLDLLWSFPETPQDRDFILSKSVLPLTIDAVLLPHPFPVEEYALNYPPLDSLVVKVNEAAIRCFGG